MAQINFKAIMVKVSKAPKCKIAALKAADERLELEKERLFNEIDSHIVSQELNEGPEASNISGTLKGLSASHGGNLFSFIGFYEDDEPVELIKEALDKLIKIKNRNALYTRFDKNNTIVFGFRVNTPNDGDFDNNKAFQFPQKYDSGSWITALEKGKLKGLSHYIYDENFGVYSKSRSGTGLQAKISRGSGKGKLITIRDGDVATQINYVLDLLNKFGQKLRK